MNSEAVKEIVLKVNGDYAERELKKIQQDIVKARKEKEAFLKNAPDASSWTKEQEKQWRELNATIGKGERQLKRWGNSADQIKRVLDNLSGSSMKELKGNLKSLERLMDSGAIKRNTKDWENLVEAIKSTKSEIQKIEKEGLYDKKRPKISCTPFIYYSFGQKLFDDKKSAFVAALIAPLKRVRRMVISVGFVKTVNVIL